MSANTPNNQDQEIDLSLLSKKIGSFFEAINTAIFKGILFVKKNIVIFSALFVLGAVLGYFLDKSSPIYDSEIVVTPNFESTEYLYKKIDLLQSKIKNQDSVFLKSIGIKNPNNISKIEIEPVVDLYSFVRENQTTNANNAQNSQNFELVKLLAEDGDIKKVIKDETTSKNYKHHTIKLSSDEFISNENTLKPILSFLNSNEFFEKTQKINFANINAKIKQNELMILQIDGMLNQFSSNNQKSEKLVYYNENTQLNDIINTKDRFISENNYLRTRLLEIDFFIKDNVKILNIKNTSGTNNKMKLILPFLSISIFVLFGLFRAFYRKQSAKIIK